MISEILAYSYDLIFTSKINDKMLKGDNKIEKKEKKKN